MKDDVLHKAQLHLRRRDELLRPVITRVGPCTLKPHRDLFGALAFAIIAQQISGKAAASIRAKFIAGPCRGKLTPESILEASDEELRAAGLSTSKRLSLVDLATHVVSGKLPLAKLKRLPDEEVIALLDPVRGIGVWTAQMFLMFSLGRPDVLPVDDLGLKTAIKRLYGHDDLPKRAAIEQQAEPWKPFRSIATWYLWRSLDKK